MYVYVYVDAGLFLTDLTFTEDGNPNEVQLIGLHGLLGLSGLSGLSGLLAVSYVCVCVYKPGNPNKHIYIQINGMINFNKRCLVADRIRWIKQYQQLDYPYVHLFLSLSLSLSLCVCVCVYVCTICFSYNVLLLLYNLK